MVFDTTGHANCQNRSPIKQGPGRLLLPPWAWGGGFPLSRFQYFSSPYSFEEAKSSRNPQSFLLRQGCWGIIFNYFFLYSCFRNFFQECVISNLDLQIRIENQTYFKKLFCP